MSTFDQSESTDDLLSSPGVAITLPSTPPAQSRLSALLRVVLVLPHLVALAGLAVMGILIGLISGLVAIFTSRVSESNQEILVGVQRYRLNVIAYACGLTSTYPRFTIDSNEQGEVNLDVTHTDLNRFAVLLRLVLVLPATVLFILATGATIILALVGWLLAVVTGRVPQSLHDATADVVRYGTRYWAYLSGATSQQAGGLSTTHSSARSRILVALAVVLCAGGVTFGAIQVTKSPPPLTPTAQVLTTVQRSVEFTGVVLQNYANAEHKCTTAACNQVQAVRVSTHLKKFVTALQALRVSTADDYYIGAVVQSLQGMGTLFTALANDNSLSDQQAFFRGTKAKMSRVSQQWSVLKQYATVLLGQLSSPTTLPPSSSKH